MDQLKTILLVEDEPDIRSVYAEFLTSAGYKVLEAADGKAGLALATSNNWDIMLLDIMIPTLDGVNVLKLLKNNPSLKEKPIILLTNVGNEGLITECFEYGADGYLIKAEITPDKILAEVQNYI